MLCGGEAGEVAEEARGEEAPNACACVHRDGAAGVIDLEAKFGYLDHPRDEQAGDGADENGGSGRDEEAGGAASDQAGDPAIGGDGGVGLAVACAGEEDGGKESAGGSERGVEDDGGDVKRRGSVEKDGGGGFEGDPADQREQASEEDLHDVVAGDGGGHAVRFEFAAARPGNPRDAGSHKAADCLNGCSTADVSEGGQIEVGGKLGETAAAPCPVREERKEKERKGGGCKTRSCETPAVGAGGDGRHSGEAGGEDEEAELEREAEREGVGRVEVDIVGEEWAAAEPVPVRACGGEGMGRAGCADGKGES